MPKAKRATSRSKKTSKSKSLFSILKSKFFLLFGVVAVLAVGFITYSKFAAVPAGINEVALNSKVAVITDGQRTMASPNGCVYKQVQCIKAPCEPILVCPTGATSAPSQVCSQEAGSCITTSGQCSGYTDGCMKAKICASPFKQCGNTTPAPSVAPTSIPSNCISWFDGCNTCSVENGVIKGCTRIACKDSTKPAACLAYASPTPTPTPVSGCYCPPGAMCKLSANCNPSPSVNPSLTPTPTPYPSAASSGAGLTNFSATKPCGNDSYLYITFACNNQKDLRTIANNVCTDFYLALKKANAECAGTSTTTTTTTGAR